MYMTEVLNIHAEYQKLLATIKAFKAKDQGELTARAVHVYVPMCMCMCCVLE
jgi:hypothetical protein